MQDHLPQRSDLIASQDQRIGKTPTQCFCFVFCHTRHTTAKITLFRLVQEALTNAYRHAGGAGQRVSLCYDGGRLHVEVADAGPGFGFPATAEWDKHLGLVGMRERVESLGGNFRVESAPGRGTRIIADVALADEEKVYE